MIHVFGGDLGNCLGQLDGGRVGALEEAVVVGQLEHLLVSGLGQLGAAVANVHAPQARHAIEHLVTLAVPQVDPFGTFDDAGATGTEILVVGERVQIVGGVHGLQGGGVQCAHVVLRYP